MEYIALFGTTWAPLNSSRSITVRSMAAVPGAYYGREMVQVAAEGVLTLSMASRSIQLGTSVRVKHIRCFQIVGRTIGLWTLAVTQPTFPGLCEAAEGQAGYDGQTSFPTMRRVPELGTGRTRVEEMMALAEAHRLPGCNKVGRRDQRGSPDACAASLMR